MIKPISSNDLTQLFKLTPACLRVWRYFTILSVVVVFIGGHYLTNHLVEKMRTNEALAVLARVRLATNAIQPYFQLNVDKSRIQSFVPLLVDKSEMRLTITDMFGNLIADTQRVETLSDLQEAPEMKAAMMKRLGHSVRKDALSERIYFAIPIVLNANYLGIVRGGVTTSRLDALSSGIRTTILIFTSFLCFCVGLLSRIFLSLLSVRLRDLEHQSDRIASGDMGMRVSDEGSDELSNIARHTNRLVSTLGDFKTDSEINKCRMKTIFNTSRHGLIIVNGNYEILEVNQVATRLTGCFDLKKGNSLADNLKCKALDTKVAEALALESPEEIEIDFTASGGLSVLVKVVGLQLHHKGSSAIIFLSDTATNDQWNRFEKDILPHWMRMVRKLDKNYKRLKNSLNDTQKMSRENLSSEASLLQIKILTRNLGMWAKDDLGDESVKVVDLDVLDAMNGSIEILQPLIQLKNIRIQNGISECIHRRVLAQEHLLKAALVHLFYLVLQETPNDGVIHAEGEIVGEGQFMVRIYTLDTLQEHSASEEPEVSFLSELDKEAAVKLLETFQAKVEFLQKDHLEIVIRIPFVAPVPTV